MVGGPPSPVFTPSLSPDPADSLDRVRAILAPLDRAQKSELFELVRAGHLENAQMTTEVGRLIVAMLNGPRTEHARRVWTGWFDPVLLRTDALILAEARLPACLHVLDAGAWWFALLPHLGDLPGQVQTDIAQRASERPLDVVLGSSAAGHWAEELRVRSLAVLRRRSGLGALLAAANAERDALLRKRGIRGALPLTFGDLATLDSMLEHAPLWKAAARPRDNASAVRLVSGMVERSGLPDGGLLYALTQLNASRDADQALAFHTLFPSSPVLESSIGHLQFAWQALRQKLEDIHLGRSAPPQLTAGETAERLLERAFRWYDALQGLGIGRGDRNWALVSMAVGRVTGLVEAEVIPAINHRLLTLSLSASPVVLTERVRFINRFNQGLARRGIATSPSPWSAAVGEHIAGLFRQVAADEHEDALPSLARLCELAEEVGHPVEVTVIDKTLLAIVEAALREGRELDAGESRLIERVVAVSTEERRKCRWWVSDELVSLLDAAQQRGIGAAPG
ncbi:hypothetical protein [Azospirillum doebereinerae]|nr:hypothetical protein [Azospirillum doebereinerae]MCG5240534.1 hypothetical protein [Azospirillum doebereinerae]